MFIKNIKLHDSFIVFITTELLIIIKIRRLLLESCILICAIHFIKLKKILLWFCTLLIECTCCWLKSLWIKKAT